MDRKHVWLLYTLAIVNLAAIGGLYAGLSQRVETRDLTVVGRDGSVLCRIAESDQGWRELTLFDEEGQGRSWCRVAPDGKPSIGVSDGFGRGRVVLGTRGEDTPYFVLRNGLMFNSVFFTVNEHDLPYIVYLSEDGKIAVEQYVGENAVGAVNTYGPGLTRVFSSNEAGQAVRAGGK